MWNTVERWGRGDYPLNEVTGEHYLAPSHGSISVSPRANVCERFCGIDFGQFLSTQGVDAGTKINTIGWLRVGQRFSLSAGSEATPGFETSRFLMLAHVLLGESVPAPTWTYVVGPIIGAAVTLLGFWLKRLRGQKVLVTELTGNSLVSVSPSVLSRIKITLDDHPVANLSQVYFRVGNSGSDTLKDVELVLDFGSITRVLDCEIQPAALATKTIPSPHNLVRILIPYLNSTRLHNEQLEVKVVCDGLPTDLRITGRGAGWTVQVSTEQDRERFWSILSFGLFLVTFAFFVLFTWFFEAVTGLNKNDGSGFHLLYYVPFFTLMIASTIAQLRRIQVSSVRRIDRHL